MQILSRVSAATALCLVATTASAGVVLANNPAGDAFNNGGFLNEGQAVGASGWYYNNVRNGGTVGIDDVYARSGNGSVVLKGTAGPGGLSSKGDIEYLSGATSNWFTGNATATTSLGLFSQFSGMRYDWYRDSASTNNAAQHPVLRILLDRDGKLNTTDDRGGLVFERAYNGGSVATNQWLSDVVGSSTNLWSFGLGLNGGDPDGGYAYDSSLAEWQGGPAQPAHGAAQAVLLCRAHVQQLHATRDHGLQRLDLGTGRSEEHASLVGFACQRLGVSRTTLYELIASGEIRSFKVGARTLIPETELRKFVAEKMGIAA